MDGGSKCKLNQFRRKQTYSPKILFYSNPRKFDGCWAYIFFSQFILPAFMRSFNSSENENQCNLVQLNLIYWVLEFRFLCENSQLHLHLIINGRKLYVFVHLCLSYLYDEMNIFYLYKPRQTFYPVSLELLTFKGYR